MEARGNPVEFCNILFAHTVTVSTTEITKEEKPTKGRSSKSKKDATSTPTANTFKLEDIEEEEEQEGKGALKQGGGYDEGKDNVGGNNNPSANQIVNPPDTGVIASAHTTTGGAQPMNVVPRDTNTIQSSQGKSSGNKSKKKTPRSSQISNPTQPTAEEIKDQELANRAFFGYIGLPEDTTFHQVN